MRGDTPRENRDKREVGAKIQKFRTERGLSQTQLAELMGKNYSRNTISLYETGSDHLRIGALFTLCDIFGVSLEELGPERLISETDEYLRDYQSLTLSNREAVKSYMDYLKSRQKSDDTGTPDEPR